MLVSLAESLMQADNFCTTGAPIIQVFGYILFIVKIAVPLILIAFGIFDLGKAVAASKEDDIKKATNLLIKRAIVAIAVFFVPTIVALLFSFVTGFADVKDEYAKCSECFLHPTTKCSVDSAQ